MLSVAPTNAPSQTPDQVRKEQLIQFYQKHEPSKVAAVDTLLSQYKFEDVVSSLQKKYGALPEGWASPSSRWTGRGSG